MNPYLRQIENCPTVDVIAVAAEPDDVGRSPGDVSGSFAGVPIDPGEFGLMRVMPVAVKHDSRSGGDYCLGEQRATLVGTYLIVGGKTPSGVEVNAVRGVMGHQHIQRVVSETLDVVAIDDLVRPPVATGGAITPVDRERAAQEPERDTTNPESASARQIGDPIPDTDGRRIVAMIG
jgi:hypothetical protein